LDVHGGGALITRGIAGSARRLRQDPLQHPVRRDIRAVVARAIDEQNTSERLLHKQLTTQ